MVRTSPPLIPLALAALLAVLFIPGVGQADEQVWNPAEPATASTDTLYNQARANGIEFSAGNAFLPLIALVGAARSRRQPPFVSLRATARGSEVPQAILMSLPATGSRPGPTGPCS